MHVGAITQVLISVGIQVYVYNNYKEKIHQHLNILPELGKRLIIIIGAILLFIVVPLFGPDGLVNGILESLAYGIPIYFLLVMLFVWIYGQFRK